MGSDPKSWTPSSTYWRRWARRLSGTGRSPAWKASKQRVIRCRRKTLESIRRTRLALKGPLETPSGGGYRSSNVRLREEFKLYANLRPARTLIPGGRFDNIDLVVVRENLEGLYIGHELYIPIDDDPHAVAMATGVNTRQGSRRLLQFAFEHAVATGRKKVAIVHKANIMKALTGIFLETGLELYERKYKGKFILETIIIDACAMKLVLNPWQFDVLVTTNLFGDILSDLVAGLVGGLGMTPGAQYRRRRRDLRSGAWLRARHRRQGHCQSDRPAARRRDDARPLPPAAHGDTIANGDRANPERRQGAHRRSGRQGQHRRIHARADRAHRPLTRCRPSSRSRGVTKSYATGFQALKLVNLDIEQGEIFALLGPERRRQDHADQHRLRHRHGQFRQRHGRWPRYSARLSRRPLHDRPGTAGTQHRCI